MVEYMARDGYYVAYAIGPADLTAWDNAQAAIALAELNALDWFVSASVQHTKPKTKEINPMTAGHIPKRLTEGVYQGRVTTTHYLQTGILTYAVMGKCTTTEATPNIHAITKATTETPIHLAFHFEKEGTTANRRKDCMGFIPISLDIMVSETVPTAKQIYTGVFSYTGAGGNLAQPDILVQATHTPYNWYHYRDAAAASEFLYHAGDINVDIVDIKMHLGWSGKLFGQYDLAGYPRNGLVIPPFTSYVDLGVRITDDDGTDINTIADLDHAAYAGDLDFICDFYESATRYLKYTWDDMYIVPDSYEEVFQEEGSWFDGATFRLAFRNETGSAVVEEKNALDNEPYENPE